MTTGKQPGALVGADAAQHLEPVELGQLEVEQDDLRQVARVAAGMRAGAEQVVERLDAVADHDDVVGDLVLARGRAG